MNEDILDGRPVGNSRFLHLLDRDNHGEAYCLYHSLNRNKVYGGAALKDLYEAFRHPSEPAEVSRQLEAKYPPQTVRRIISDLLRKDLLTHEDNTDLHNYLRHFTVGQQLYHIRHAYFVPNSDCNLRCKYCFVEDQARGFPVVRMSRKLARKSLDVFAQLTQEADEISLTFYGGEPLLNEEVVYDCMYYIRRLEEKGKFAAPVEVTLLTNGTRINEATVRAVVDAEVKVSVSMDGPERLHDSARVAVGQGGSFREALNGYRLMQEAGVDPGVSCTLSSYNIHQIDAIVEYIVEELSPPGMGFNILLPTIASGNPLDVDHEFATEQLIRAFKVLREHGIYEDRVMRRVRPFKDDFFHFKDCMGVGGQVVIAPDGRIGPCQAYLNMPGMFPWTVDELHAQLPDIDSDLLYTNPLFEEWRSRFPLNMHQCADCYAIAVCGGGCPYAAQVNHGSIWELDDRICYQAKGILDWMIWETYDRMVDDTIFPSQRTSLAH